MPSRHILALLLTLLPLHGCGEPDTDEPADPGPPSPSPDATPADANPPNGVEEEGRVEFDGVGSSSSSPPVSDGVNPPRNDVSHSADDDPPPISASRETVSGLPSASPSAEAPTSPVRTAAVPSGCAATLPCTQELGDGPLAVTLHAADGEALDGSGPLRVDFVVESRSRDATVSIERSSSIVAGGQVLEADALSLGLPQAPGATDEASFALVAGVPINGYATFSGTLVGNPATLDRLTLRLGEAGRPLEATFANVPLGAEPSAPVDCANALPCDWRPDDGTVTLVLSDAAPLRWNRATRLAVSFSIASTRPLELALLPVGRVTNGAGETLEPYGIELGADSSHDGTPLLHPLGAGERVAGRLVPRRAPDAGETSLARVELPLVERRSPRAPRWRPVFLNVPLSPPAADD